MTMMGATYHFDRPRVEDIPGWHDTRIADRPGIEPPGSEMPWPAWRELEADLAAPPGWSACRFPTWRPGEHPVRIESGAVDTRPENAGTCAFVFGIVRGDFGIWLSPFPVCVTSDDGMLQASREDVLAAITHLPSGLGMGVFTERDAAIALCCAVEAVGSWRSPAPSAAMQIKFHQAREFAGITPSLTRHAHYLGPDGPRLTIWEQRAEDIIAGRPEKLS